MNDDWIWWKHGVMYHIFPLSFQDSNNDGFGDLRGIIQKLDYLVFLEIDAIWISPFFTSPMKDGGYDVAGYLEVDPVFGTMADLDELIRKAHSCGIRIILDLVLNHTSDQHPWFRESASSVSNSKSDWYIWNAGKDRKKPSNWASSVGGSAWSYVSSRNQYYYHSFFSFQPDLNWEHPELIDEFRRIIHFWLEKGVDGFRLDVANMTAKTKIQRNLPLFLTNLPYLRKHTLNQPGSYYIIKELRKEVQAFSGRILIGEIYVYPPGNPEIAASYLGPGNDLLHLAFDFSIFFKRWNASSYQRCIDRWQNSIPEGAWPCNVFSNHDLLRAVGRFGKMKNPEQKAKIIVVLLLTLKGTPIIYYGDELGMTNAPVRRNDMADPLGKKFWPFYKGRDRARTPMQWSPGQNAGFSETTPWLKGCSRREGVNVEEQLRTRSSVLILYKSLRKLRKLNTVLQKGEFSIVNCHNRHVLAYQRSESDQTILIILNFSAGKKKIQTDTFDVMYVLFSSHRKEGALTDLRYLRLYPYEYTLFTLTNQLPAE